VTDTFPSQILRPYFNSPSISFSCSFQRIKPLAGTGHALRFFTLIFSSDRWSVFLPVDEVRYLFLSPATLELPRRSVNVVPSSKRRRVASTQTIGKSSSSLSSSSFLPASAPRYRSLPPPPPSPSRPPRPRARRFMSSGSSTASSASAGSHQRPRSGWGDNGERGSATLSGTQRDSAQHHRRADLIMLDRKRRLTASGEDGVRRPRVQGGEDAGPSSRMDIHRPVPLPTGSRDDPLLVSSSPDCPRHTTIIDDPASAPPLTPSLGHHSLPLSPQREDFMEYILPRWQPDAEVAYCPICGIQFNFWYRKHHCRKCGRVVCASCSPHRITIPRQFIVRPSAAQERPASGMDPPVTGASLGVDRTGADTQLALMLGVGEASRGPGLGGGEEVRLCNPCVPDPNPDPPIGYRALRSSLDRAADTEWAASRLSAFPTGHLVHQRQRSVSAATGSSQTDLEQGLRRYRGRSMVVSVPRSPPWPR
jgi:FYVE zinc finger